MLLLAVKATANIMKPAVFALAVTLAFPSFAQDPLPSWNDTAPKKAVVAFIEKVTKEGSADFVPALPPSRSASSNRGKASLG